MSESKSFCASYLTKFVTDFDGMWYALETNCFDVPHTDLIFFFFFLIYIQEREANLRDFVKKKQQQKS